jgi:hypothetical protein
VIYTYGFPSTIGAGPYDRRIGREAPPTPAPPADRSGGGPHALVGSGSIPISGTVTLDDSLTYTAMDDVVVQGCLTFRAANEQRPVIRLAPMFSGEGRTPGSIPAGQGWTERSFTGGALASGAPGNGLVLDGLFFSGFDIVLKGTFDCVTLTCCTLDPGSAAPPTEQPAASSPSLFAEAQDGRDLVPCRVWIEGLVGTLTVERCITGPIRTRRGGEVATLTITDSIIQAIPTGDVIAASVPYSAPAASHSAPAASVPHSVPAASVPHSAPGLPHSAPGFSYSWASIPEEPADLALALTDGDVILSRCTVLGAIAVHRLQASECILWDVAQVDDTQHGCVRFSVWAVGSQLPRQYESVRIAPEASLFTSTDFGQPGYGQLLPTVDAAILPTAGPAPPSTPSIATGAQNGSEMGAYSRDLNPIKERGLLIKYQEFMPAGLVPVVIYVT